MKNLNDHEISLVIESLEEYKENLDEYDEYIEKMMEDVKVTQELEELKNDNRLLKEKLETIQHKIINRR